MTGIGMTSRRTRERLIGRLMEEGIRDWRVLDLIRSTPRHIFLDEALSHRAYEDVALPIGHGQTISQPYVVARMTEAVLQSADPATGRLGKVLDVGTGCGYQAAIIAQLADEVISIERIRALQEKARRNLAALGIRNVRLRLDDGTLGWSREAPYDAIIAAAAPSEVPRSLLDQLADNGRLVIPVGNDHTQALQLIHRQGDAFHQQTLATVRFVPLRGGPVER
jgi:protein-L-isoaspartate(D-aspartate) O-methyltransferase